MDPEYGKVEKLLDNKTHLGGITLQFYQKIPSFVIKIKIESQTKDLVFSRTINLCDRQSISRMIKFAEKALMIMPMPKDAPKISQMMKCPVEVFKKFHDNFFYISLFFSQKGNWTFEGIGREVDLPFLVPSFFANPGIFLASNQFVLSRKSEEKTFLSLNCSMKVEKIDE